SRKRSIGCDDRRVGTRGRLGALREGAARDARRRRRRAAEANRAADRRAAGPARRSSPLHRRGRPVAAATAGGAQTGERPAALRAFLARARALALDPGAAQELAEFPRRPSVRLHGDPGLHGARPPVEVERELPLLRARDERAEAEGALAEAERAASGARSAAWEAALEALSEMGGGEPIEAAAALHRQDPRTLGDGKPEDESPAAACERLLRETDDLARDLGGWILERHTGAHPYPG